MSDASTASAYRALRGRVGRLLRDVHLRYVLGHQLRLQTWLRVGRHHVAPIDPFRTLSVDPRTIDRWVDMDYVDYRRIRYAFDVLDGDWDLDTRPLAEHFVYASFEAHLSDGVPWEATELHAIAMQGIRDGSGRYHGCRSLDALRERLAKLDTLCDRLRRDGYRPQRDLARSGESLLRRFGHRPPELDEVVVHIGRSGELILVDGVHRFSIARILGIEAIPVIVLFRHSAWQRQRNDHARAGFPALGPGAHPDLALPHGAAPRFGRSTIGSRTS